MTRFRRALERLLERASPRLQCSFIDAIRRITRDVDIRALEAALERGNVEEALNLIGVDQQGLDTVTEALTQSYRDMGRDTATLIPRGEGASRAAFRFDVRNPVAERWIGQHSASFITGLVEVSRAAVRQELRAGLERGDNPRTTALEIAGRVSRATGRREGGIIGLTPRQAETVRRTRDELLSGDPARLRAYLRRDLRDKRFDRAIERAIRDKTPLSRAQAERITGRYADRALKWRADLIARTETTQALHAAQHETFRQAVADGRIRSGDVDKTWRSARTPRTRDSHNDLHGTTVGLSDLFVSIHGNLLMHPGDTSHGAGLEDIAHCECRAEYRIRPEVFLRRAEERQLEAA